MANPPIPRAQVLAAAWMQTFANRISDNPSVYQLMPSDAAAIQKVVNNFVDALAVATVEPTRTKVTVNAKDTARNSPSSFACSIIR